jgi:predicted dehydrogenase
MTEPDRRTRYAIVGTGHRSQMYFDAILAAHADVAELVALADTNKVRAKYFADRAEASGVTVAVVEPSALAEAIRTHRIDRVIITTPDLLHAPYIDIALRAGADVVVEKPLTIDVDGCRQIARATEETGRSVTVAFNYRYSPRNTRLKELLQSGAIGRVTSVHFEWLLDTSHGADYFRRWHRDKANSGGLLVHKSSHHFDLVNWWINDSPRSVYAHGGLRFYGTENARDRGVGTRPQRGTHDGSTDPFQLDLRNDDRLKSLYLDAEQEDGYLRDRDVFSDGITIEDTLSLLVDYDAGPTMTYSLTAYSPWEGYRVSINGTEGRLELDVVERAAVLTEGATILDPSFTEDVSGSGAARSRGERLVLQRHWEEAEEVPIPEGEGGHGGGDELLLADIFLGNQDDPLGRPASWIDGVRSVAVGIAGNISLKAQDVTDVRALALGVDLTRTEAGR